MLQSFGWDEYSQPKITAAGNYYKFMQAKAVELKAAGFDMIWMPPPSASTGGDGYIPTELYNFNSSWGTATDLTNATAALKAVGIHPIADVVVNHRNGTTNWSTFTNPDWGTTSTTDNGTICSTDELNSGWVSSRGPQGTGAADEGQDFSGGRDLNHQSSVVQQGVKAYLAKLKEQGFEGWRWDMVKGYNGSHVKDYNASSTPYFSVGENWDGSSVIIPWIDASGSAAFDFVTYYNMCQQAFKNSNWAALGSGTTMGGVAGTYGYSEKAVTFVDNHDTFVSSDAPSADATKIMEGYAYILTHPGIPCVFMPHYYGGSYSKDGVTRNFGTGNKTKIDELMAVRKTSKIDAWSSISVANTSGYYAAYIKKRYADTDAAVAVCIGTTSWTPSGSGWVLNTSGTGYKVWSKSAILTAPSISPSSGTYFSTQTVTMTASAGSTIYYTIDGTTPTTSSSVYTSAISLKEGCITTIKAIAVSNAGTSSVVSAVFTVPVKGKSIVVKYKAPSIWTKCSIWMWEKRNGTDTNLQTVAWPGVDITSSKDADGYYSYTISNNTQATVGLLFNNGVASGTTQTIDLSTYCDTNWDTGTLSSGKYAPTIASQATLSDCATSGFEDVNGTESWKVYPNPVKDMVTVEMPENITRLTVTNLLGKQLFVSGSTISQNLQIDFSGYAPGVYFITLTKNDGSFDSKKVIKY